ncbi:MAG: hypothetical protein WCE45_06180 [Sedimentisphaerales bacterium]
MAITLGLFPFWSIVFCVLGELNKMKTPHTVLLHQYLGGDESNVIAFKEAGDELVDFVVRGKKYRWYEDFLRPIGFLYRHYLELELKYWLKELKGYPLDQAGSLLKEHNLSNLWLKLKPLIQPFCETEGDQKILSEVEEVILTFDKYDPTGQEFRYTRTTKGANALKNLPSKIAVEEFKRLVGRVYFFFDGLGGAVSV